MSKSLYFDIQFGASGDMLLAAMIDFGLDFRELIRNLSLLNLENWEINPVKVVKQSLSGTVANVKCSDDNVHRNIHDVQKIIQESGLGSAVKSNILKIFHKLAEAEAKVHGKSKEQIHFHEIGAADSIIDISAFCIAIDILDIENIYFNEFHLGTGVIKSAHGEIPIPVPAVVELIKGYKSILTNRNGELITPTAAAILSVLGHQVPDGFELSVLKNGVGFGTRDYPFASYTRSFLIETGSTASILQVECNIDDMNPQLYPAVIQQLLDGGALDAYTCGISMKKGRPGILLTVITDKEKIEDIKNIIYSNTTTLGLRYFEISREKLFRKYEKVTVFGYPITIKTGYLNDKLINIHPEFEDCKNAADKLKIALKDIMTEALFVYKKQTDQKKHMAGDE